MHAAVELPTIMVLSSLTGLPHKSADRAAQPKPRSGSLNSWPEGAIQLTMESMHSSETTTVWKGYPGLAAG